RSPERHAHALATPAPVALSRDPRRIDMEPVVATGTVVVGPSRRTGSRRAACQRHPQALAAPAPLLLPDERHARGGRVQSDARGEGVLERLDRAVTADLAADAPPGIQAGIGVRQARGGEVGEAEHAPVLDGAVPRGQLL